MKLQIICYLHFGKFRNMVGALCGGSSRFSENEDSIQFVTLFSEICEQPSSSPKTKRLPKKIHLIWSIWAPRAPSVIYTPHIWSHHPMLDFHTQITRKYSTAMCSMCSCSDQRSENNLLSAMKGVESLRMQSFKGLWKSRKIPGLDF